MTERATNHAPRPLTSTLKHAIDLCRESSHAADCCEQNLDWISRRDAQMMLFLDFDVICGALPSLALQYRLQSNGNRTGTLHFPAPGPLELRALLSNLDGYTLPPGAVAELIARREAIKSVLRDQSVSFLRLLNSGGPEKLQEALVRANDLKSLWQSLQEFLAVVDENVFLKQVLSKCKPYTDVLKTDISLKPDTAFDDCKRHLDRRRPQDLNNWHDALNVATIVEVFKQASAPAYVPVLISQTREILESQKTISRHLDPPYEPFDLPQLFSSRLYLSLFHNIRENFGDECRKASKCICARLKQRVEALRNAYRELADVLEKNRAPHTDSNIEILLGKRQDLADRLHQAQKDFLENSACYLAVPDNLVVPDRVTYLNQIVSGRTRELLKSAAYSDQKDGVRRIAQELRNSGTLFDDIAATWHQFLTIRCGTRDDAALKAIFELTEAPADGTLLRDTPRGRRVGAPPPDLLLRQHRRRVAAHLRIPSQGAVLAVDSVLEEGDGQTRNLAFTWRHKVDFAFLLDNLLPLVAGTDTNGAEIDAKLFTRQGDFAVRCKAAEFLSAAEERAKSLEDIQYFEVEAAGRLCLADTQLLDETEMQACVMVPTDPIRASWLAGLCRAIARTTFVRLSELHLNGLVRWACEVHAASVRGN